MNQKAIILAALIFGAFAGWAQKKLIFHSWDLMDVTPEEVLVHADAFDRTGSDGVALNAHGTEKMTNGAEVSGITLMFGNKWRRADFAAQLPVLREIAAHRALRESFIQAWWIPCARVAWTNDAAWRILADNLSILASLAKESGLPGILGDFEDYYKQRQFCLQAGESDFDTAYELARRRGRETFGAMFAAYPEITFLTFQLFTTDTAYLTAADPVAYMRSKGDLLPAYFNGMLDVLPPTARFVDGNESVGYLAEASKGDFYRSCHDQITTVLPLVAPENRAKYRAQLLISFGLYIDSYVQKPPSPYAMMETRGSRLIHFEENLNQALDVADEYVWIYGEKHSWIPWKGVRKSRPMKKTDWESGIPDVYSMIRRVKNPAAFAASAWARCAAEGRVENRMADPGCECLTAWGMWQQENKRQGRFFVDGKGGIGGSPALAIEGAENGCYVGRVTDVKMDEIYGVMIRSDGKYPGCTVKWRKGGKWVCRERNSSVRFSASGADGWRLGADAVRVPEGADELCLTFGGGKLAANEIVRFDDIAVFRIQR